MGFNHLDFDPYHTTLDELLAAYEDLRQRANTLATENGLLHQRLAAATGIVGAVAHLGHIMELRDESLMSLAPGDPDHDSYDGELEVELGFVVKDARAFLTEPTIRTRTD